MRAMDATILFSLQPCQQDILSLEDDDSAPPLEATQKDEKVALLVRQVIAHERLTRELRLQVLDLQEQPFALVIVAQLQLAHLALEAAKRSSTTQCALGPNTYLCCRRTSTTDC